MTESYDPLDVDLSMIRDLADGDRETEHQFIRLFISETQRLLEEMSHHCTNGPNTGWVEAAHTIKGGASNIGAKELHRLAFLAEKNNSDATTAQDRVSQFAELARVSVAVISHLEKQMEGTA